LKPFEFFEPKSVKEALSALSKWGSKARVLAGGVTLVDDMRRRVVTPECVVSMQSIPGIDYIKRDGKSGLKIGAMATLRAVEISPVVQRDYLPLYEGIRHIHSLQTKYMGTLVGNLCVASPASDITTPLIALGAELKIRGRGRARNMLVESFLLGVNRTALRPDEIVAEISLPSPARGTGGAFLRLARTAADVAKLNVAVVMTVSGNVCRDVRIALGAVAPTPIRARKAEDVLKGQKLGPETIAQVAAVASEEARPISDFRSTVEYRTEMIRLLVRRALEAALERARG
jgi:carbon-monoxide dehydrogenase medium subunit